MEGNMDDDADRYWMPPTGSTKRPPNTALSKTTRREQVALDRSLWILNQARRVLGSYRKDDFADPEVYVTTLVEILERYDDKVIEAVTSPTTGIMRTCKFPPSIAEFVEFIEEHIRQASFSATYDARSRKQLEEREEFERQAKAETPEYRKQVADRIRNELRERGFQFSGDTKPAQNTWKRFTAEELLAKYPPKSG